MEKTQDTGAKDECFSLLFHHHLLSSHHKIQDLEIVIFEDAYDIEYLTN